MDEKEYAELDLSKVKVRKGHYSKESMERWNRVGDKILAEDPPGSKPEGAGETEEE